MNIEEITTVIFQTVWHFASASRLKFSHDDFQTDSDWIFKINDICISNRKSINTLTNRIQSAFGVFFFKTLQNTCKIASKTRAIVNIDMLFYMNNDCISHYAFKSNFLCTVFLIEVCIWFTTKPCSTHTKCDWSLYCLFCVWYANFIDTEDPIVVFIMNFRPLAEAKCHTVWKMIKCSNPIYRKTFRPNSY